MSYTSNMDAWSIFGIPKPNKGQLFPQLSKTLGPGLNSGKSRQASWGRGYGKCWKSHTILALRRKHIGVISQSSGNIPGHIATVSWFYRQKNMIPSVGPNLPKRKRPSIASRQGLPWRFTAQISPGRMGLKYPRHLRLPSSEDLGWDFQHLPAGPKKIWSATGNVTTICSNM